MLKKRVIWLGSSHEKELQDIIHLLSEKTKSPAFKPHITLLGSTITEDDELFFQTVENICLDFSCLEITLRSIRKEDYKWRSFYYLAHPFEPLFLMHQKLAEACSIFGHKKQEDYMPHLSLSYCDTDLSEKNIIEKNNSDLFIERKLIFDKIHIAHFIPENISEWNIEKTFDLHKSS